MASISTAVERAIVISEVAVTGVEYIEIYNQGEQEISLGGWTICYYPAGRTSWDEYLNCRSIPAGVQIEPYGYLLISLASSANWSYSVDPDLIVEPGIRASDRAGAIALFSGDPSANQPCDVVAWGDSDLAEGAPASVTSEGLSLGRRFEQIAGMWNLVDTGDNSTDFSSMLPTPSSSRFALSLYLQGAVACVPLGLVDGLAIRVRNAGSECLCLDLSAADELGWEYLIGIESFVLRPGAETSISIEIHRTAVEYVALDIETTGFSPESDDIIEIAWCEFADGELVAANAELISPSARISTARLEDACGFTGIPLAALLAARSASGVLPEVFGALSGQVVVVHSGTGFDERFLGAEAVRIGASIPDIEWVDSLTAAKVAFPGLESYSLADICGHLGIESEHHRALPDAAAAGLVYWQSLLQLGNTLTLTLHASGEGADIAHLQVALPLSSRAAVE